MSVEFNSKKRHKSSKWTEEEDEKIKDWVASNGEKDWVECSKTLNNKSNKQARERWLFILNPNLKKTKWNIIEDYILFRLYKIYSSKWNLFCLYLNGRSEVSIKNRFYILMRVYINSCIYKLLPKSFKFKVSSLRLTKKEILSYFPYAYKQKTEMIEKYLFEELNYSQSDIESENILKKVYSNFNNNDFLTYYKKIKSE